MDSYAELYENNPAGSTITVVVAGNFYQWVTTTVGQSGPTDLAVPSAATDDITIGVNGAGLYGVMVISSFNGSNNAVAEVAVHVNGALQPNLQISRKLSAAGDEGAVSISGLLVLAAGDVVDLRVSSDGAGDVVIIKHANLTIFSIVRDK